MLRIVLFAWCSGAAYADALARAGAPPVVVVTGPASDSTGELAAAAARAGAMLRSTNDPNDADFVAELAALAPDLLVVTGCPHILRAPVLALPRLGALNVHPSLLPHYRGKEPIFWALLRSEPTVGVTLHRMTEDVDAGPILAQRELSVGPRATSRAVGAELDRLGVEAVTALVAEAAATNALPEGRTPGEAGSAFPPLRPEHGLIDWVADAATLDRFVRACDGVLAAHTYVRGMRVIVLEAEAVSASPARSEALPGTILRVGGGALVVATGSGELALRRTAFLRAQRAEELADMLGLREGDRFRCSPAL